MDYMDALRTYWETFGERFPMEQFGGSEADAVEEMRRCIESGEPYEPEEGVVY